MEIDIDICEEILKSEHSCFLVEMEDKDFNCITGNTTEITVGIFFTDYKDCFQKELTIENAKNIYNKGCLAGFIFNKYESMQFYDYIKHAIKIYPFPPKNEIISALLSEKNAKSFYDYKKIIEKLLNNTESSNKTQKEIAELFRMAISEINYGSCNIVL